MKTFRAVLILAVVTLALAWPARAAGVSIYNWDWNYDAGMVMIRGTMANTSGLSLPITLFVMEDTKTIYEYKMIVSYAERTEFSFMFPRDKKPASVKLEWGARQGFIPSPALSMTVTPATP